MSKAFVIIDMPESCTKCDLGKSGRCCIKDFSTQLMNDCRASICPLKEVPEKKEVLKSEEYVFGKLGVAFIQGYNACIDKILGNNR